MQRFNWRHPLRSWRSRQRQWWETAAEFHPDDGFDPLGSYGGRSEDDDGMPEQDADDL